MVGTTFRWVITGAFNFVNGASQSQAQRCQTPLRPSNAAETYTYNVRSWPKTISSTLFSETLYYNDTYGGSTAQYGGTLSNVDLVLKSGATLQILNNGILETRNGFEAPIGAIVDIQNGQLF